MTVLTIDPRIKFRCSLAAIPGAPGLGRHFLAQLLDLWGVDAESAESALLLLSELVTNSVRHAGRPSGPATLQRGEVPQLVAISAQISTGRLYIEVWDSSPNVPTVKDVDEDAEDGRGMHIVSCLAHKWGCHPAILRHTPGKVTWFELELPSPPNPRQARPANEAAAQPVSDPAPQRPAPPQAAMLPRRQAQRAPVVHRPPHQAQTIGPVSRYDTSLAAMQRLEAALLSLRTPDPRPRPTGQPVYAAV